MKAILKNRIWCAFIIAALLGGCAGIPHMKQPQPYNNFADFYSATNSGSPGWFSQLMKSISGLDVDEVWVIPRSSGEATAAEGAPDSGALLANVRGAEMPLPLTHTDVKASVDGCLATVNVTQQFENPCAEKIEAVYVFPLPHNAAINEFIMTIGKRRIRGIIRERKEAEAIYEEAKRQGYRATLLAEERPNVFTQSVANIEPGNEIDVNIKYFQTLDYRDGWFEFVFPMASGPRFNPSEEQNGADISLRVDVDARAPIAQMECATHAITKEIVSPEHLVAQLKPRGVVSAKDFVLRYRLAGDQMQSSLLTHHDQRGDYFSLMLFPPREVGNLLRKPMELVFVLDWSRRMAGRPMQQAKTAVERGLRLLEPGDSFQIIDCSASASQLGPEPAEATPENVQRGLNFLRSLNANGGAMVEGMRAALDFPHDSKRLRYVCVLTDGDFGNEAGILNEVHNRAGASRIFSVGIGPTVNRYLLEEMARAGRGTVAYLRLNDDAAKVMEDFFQRVSHPAMTNVKIDWGAMDVSDVFPIHVPDLFPGRMVVLTGQYKGEINGAIRVTGEAKGAPARFEVPANSIHSVTNNALPNVWARMKIAELADQLSYAPTPQLPYEIRRVALDYGLISPFTTFMAVDASGATPGNSDETAPATSESNNGK